ncbi:tryptophan synthase subunit alpha [Conexibacter sp. DBS9H8]|uniref:tryptophan synthase subunit alpha n=1 Tax=Conexibacter sp. DBS9H8 TaxID=2937801 RepID=UPI00200BA569|nr:tryptophan synthase subunit alpha [Conexibacter sp. DBS9H8]
MTAAHVTAPGTERIAEAFARAHADGRRAALMPYMMAGYPDVERSREIAAAYVDGGADLIELGIPFSDPLADGPVIHAAAVAALEAGATLHECLTVAAAVAERVPVILMSYINPILARGVERFCDELVATGVCGLIVPDLPREESGLVTAACAARGLALVPLVAPTTPPDRMTEIVAAATGFIYTVAVTGTTGERTGSDGDVPALLARVRGDARVPVALGFGISTPEQASAAAAAGAEGVIVGSRFVRAAGEADAVAIGELVRAFATALR